MFAAPSTDPDDPYVRDRTLAVARFDPASFAKRFEHRRARIDGVLLHYVVGGSGPLILFGHGWPASWYEWRKVMPLLADRFTCVALDLPGLGDSAPAAAFDPATIGALTAKFVREELETTELFVVAHDVSGPPFLHMAAHHAGLARKMVLTETSIAGPEMGKILSEHLNEIWHFPMNAARLTPTFATGREEHFIPQFFTEWVYNVGAIGPDDLAEYVRTARRPGALESGAAYYHSPAGEADGSALPPASLTMPILFIAAELGFGGWLGGEDRAAFKTVERFATNIDYEVLDRCSHWVSEDRPATLADRIGTFFQD